MIKSPASCCCYISKPCQKENGICGKCVRATYLPRHPVSDSLQPGMQIHAEYPDLFEPHVAFTSQFNLWQRNRSAKAKVRQQHQWRNGFPFGQEWVSPSLYIHANQQQPTYIGSNLVFTGEYKLTTLCQSQSFILSLTSMKLQVGRSVQYGVEWRLDNGAKWAKSKQPPRVSQGGQLTTVSAVRATWESTFN